jgi:hypothetical protein
MLAAAGNWKKALSKRKPMHRRKMKANNTERIAAK